MNKKGKKNKSYNVMVVPHNKGTILNFRLPRFILPLSLLSILIILSTAVIFGILFFRSHIRLDEAANLKEENRSQKIQMMILAEKVDYLNNQLANIKRFDHKLRNILNIKVRKDEENPVSGIGGPSPEDLSLLANLDTTHKIVAQRMHYDLENLKVEFSWEEESLQEIYEYLADQKSILTSTPSIRPTSGWLTSGFGYRRSPFTGLKTFHKGVDISAPIGTPIIAPADGVVIFVGRQDNYGKMLVIQHGYGITTRYGHISNTSLKVGNNVKRGYQVATVGNTGRSTGPHLHYEVRLNGIPTDPIKYFLDE